ncbi:hypothetical protein B0H34DRAFT_701890 [Crassisporium funariophilum]|nr:hypothetical protein B0H34DRAFT_701890 [Crassisporium funariophilum]
MAYHLTPHFIRDSCIARALNVLVSKAGPNLSFAATNHPAYRHITMDNTAGAQVQALKGCSRAWPSHLKRCLNI